jgi:hypothetical protein
MKCVSHSMCNLCENPFPYKCDDCNCLEEELQAMGKEGLSAVSTTASMSLGMAARIPEIVRTWIGSGEDAAEFQRNGLEAA